MGGIFSRRPLAAGDLAAQYSSELLRLEGAIAALQARKQAQLSFKRRLSRTLVLYGSLAWLMLAAALYVADFPNRTHVVARCLRIGPIVLWPILYTNTQAHSTKRLAGSVESIEQPANTCVALFPALCCTVCFCCRRVWIRITPFSSAKPTPH